MPTQITQTDAPDSDVTILKVSGEMMEGDAVIVERVVTSIREETARRIIIDLAGLDLLDSEAAPALLRLGQIEGVSVEGIESVIQSSIDQAERAN